MNKGGRQDKLPAPFLEVGTMHKALKRYSPIFVLPTLLAFIIGFIVPFAQGLYLSFVNLQRLIMRSGLDLQIIMSS